jgi:hypothetical protein
VLVEAAESIEIDGGPCYPHRDQSHARRRSCIGRRRAHVVGPRRGGVEFDVDPVADDEATDAERSVEAAAVVNPSNGSYRSGLLTRRASPPLTAGLLPVVKMASNVRDDPTATSSGDLWRIEEWAVAATS